MTEQEQRAILTIGLMAMHADAKTDEREDAHIQSMAASFSGSGIDFAALNQDVLLRKHSLSEIARQLTTPEARKLAFEMAVQTCNADEVSNAPEQQFLQALQSELQLSTEEAAAVQKPAQELSTTPLPQTAPAKPGAAVNEAELDKTILNASILNGALELLPETLSTMAILPLQMKMVYRIGQQYGYEMDRGYIKDFLATLGVGVASQYVEVFARKIFGGLLGGLGRQAASSGMSFATTYALGQVAKKYYAGGRKIDAAQLKTMFSTLLSDAAALKDKYGQQIQQKMGEVKGTNLVALVKNQ